MDNSFLEYLQRLQLIAFFSGYPLVYAITFFVSGMPQLKSKHARHIVSHLPYAYALAGTLFLGFLANNFYPDFSIEKIRLDIQNKFLVAVAILSILFWIPFLAKKKLLSLIHSFIFFFLLVKDIFLQSFGTSPDWNIVRNDMKMYTASLILFVITLSFLLLISFLYALIEKHRNSTSHIQ
ncbi:MAG TPA: hypothetical protein PLA68_01870 [Panacibacter sp.]|nr:hypothetical protein [Panacibacter sp.]